MLIETRDLQKIYLMGSVTVTALAGVSVHIPKQKFISLIGTSGSGKSTLLNLIGGLDRPTSGEIFYDDKPLGSRGKREMAHYRRNSVGMIFQNFNLIPQMSAIENVELALAFGGERGRARRAHASNLLARVGLIDRLWHKPTELSGGEQQRVAIARALANQPKLLLADEPTGNLDSVRSHDLLALLREMVDADGLTVLMVTHDVSLAGLFSDQTITMSDGRVSSN